MFCKNCGRQIPDNATFCPACGTKRSGSDTFGEEKSGRDIKNLPNYAKENDLNRSGDAIDTNRQKFSLSGNGKRFSLSGSDQQKFSLSGQKKFSLSDKGKDSGDGIVRISTNREPAATSKAPTGFVNPLKDSGKTVFHDEPAGNTAGGMSEKPAAPDPEVNTSASATSPAPEQTESQTIQAVSVVLDGGAEENNAGGETTGFVNPLKDSGQNIHWGSDGDRNETQNAGFADDPSEIESHLGFAVFTLLCCCQPTSILAILFAVLVSQEVKKGNYEQAQKYSNLAKLFCWISIGLSIFCGGISSITNMNEWSSVIRSPVNP
ncbi:MAG: CD225/dispanin family protein [Lentisphaeria bacterium]|nr:CD225/dispanin family protein [Lentisphaeria bacterium]